MSLRQVGLDWQPGSPMLDEYANLLFPLEPTTPLLVSASHKLPPPFLPLTVLVV